MRCDGCGYEAQKGWDSFGSEFLCNDCFNDAVRWKGRRYIIEECARDFVEEFVPCRLYEEPPTWFLDECLADDDAVQKWCEENAPSFIRWL